MFSRMRKLEQVLNKMRPSRAELLYFCCLEEFNQQVLEPLREDGNRIHHADGSRTDGNPSKKMRFTGRLP